MERSCVCPEPKKGTLPEEFLYHVKDGYVEKIEEWLAAGGDVNAATKGGQTLLSAACLYQSLDVWKRLLDEPNIHLNTAHRMGTMNHFTPLCIAAFKGSQDFVTTLLEVSSQCRLNLEAKTGKGKNALLLAAEKGHWEIVEMLSLNIPIPQEDANILTSLARLSKKSRMPSYIQGLISQVKEPEEDVLSASERVYSNSTSPRGPVLILNYKFEMDPESVREGTDADAAKLHRIFQNMGYETEEYRDLTKEETHSKIVEFCGQDQLKNASCVIVVVLSHGKNRDTFFTVDHKSITMKQLFSHFSDERCPQLKGKPKIFLMQFCRGADLASQANFLIKKLPVSDHHEIQTDAIKNAFTDMFCIYSAQEGFVSYRFKGKPLDPFTGTPFIEAFCQVLETKGHLWLDDLLREFMVEYKNTLGGQPIDCHNLNFVKKFSFNSFA